MVFALLDIYIHIIIHCINQGLDLMMHGKHEIAQCVQFGFLEMQL